VNAALGWPETAPLRVHPLHLIEPVDLLLVDLWRRCRGGEPGPFGGGGPGPLPEAGGVLDQAVCTMESLAVIEAAYQAVRPKPARRSGPPVDDK
jgi:hypothetical protein